jgi:hypothetical protein
MFRAAQNPLAPSRGKTNVRRFYNVQPDHYAVCILPATIISTFVVHTVEEALHGIACISILSCALEFETVLEGGSIGVTELKYTTVLMVKHLIYIPNVVGSDSCLLFPSSTL